MGTSWSVRLVVAGGMPASIGERIDATLSRIVAQMSHWEPGSQLSGFNRAALGRWQPLPPEFARVLAAGLSVSEASGGAFDPAMGALVDLWGFGPAGSRPVPDPGAVAEALARSGRERIEFDRVRLSARRTGPALLDFSAIAKGFAVDALADQLRALGIADFLVEIGGELLGEGIKPDGQPWWVEVERVPDARLAPIRVALHGLAVATSGDYRRHFTHKGRRYAHTLDPRTGMPLGNGVATVTVLHAECMMADAWATALSVLGPEQGMALAEREGLAAHMVVREGDGFRELVSPALEAMLEV